MVNPGDNIAAEARTHIGKQYVLGTQGPNTFDCSGLVQYCYQQGAGISITAGSEDQRYLGNAVAKGNLRPGDILWFDTNEDGDMLDSSHTGIYVGPNEMVNALNPTDGVKISNPFSSYFDPRYMGARRIATYDDSQAGTGTGSGGGTSPSSGYQVGDEIEVLADVRKLYSARSVTSSVNATPSTGTKLTVLEAPTVVDGTTWVKVRPTSGSVQGYIPVVVTKEVTTTTNPSGPTYTHKVTGSPLNLRSSGSTSGTLIATLPVGTRLVINSGPVSNQGYQWYNVSPEGYSTGYCVNGFTTI